MNQHQVDWLLVIFAFVVTGFCATCLLFAPEIQDLIFEAQRWCMGSKP